MSDFLDYARGISNGAPNVELARVAGVNKSTVGRWDSHTPALESVRRLAAHYGAPLTEALIAAGHLTPDEARTSDHRTLTSYTDHELMHELGRRLARTSPAPATITVPEEDPNPDDYELAAGHVDRPDDDHTD